MASSAARMRLCCPLLALVFAAAAAPAQAQLISTHAGGGIGDGGPAREAFLRSPQGAAYDADGNLYFADTQHHRVRRVGTDGRISTVAGTGTQGFSGDGGNATAAQLNRPQDVALDAAGNLYIADRGNRRIRKVSGGVISTVGGNGTSTFRPDGEAATATGFGYPGGITAAADGTVYVADGDLQYVRRITTAGLVETVAGNGVAGFSGDGGPAKSASLAAPSDVVLGPLGHVYISDTFNQRIRRVTPGGTIGTFAGIGESGFSGDNGPGTAARLANPQGLGVDAAGNVYVADEANDRIRRLSPGGTIITVAGSGNGFESNGNGGPALDAVVRTPTHVAVSPAGELVISENGVFLRRVGTDGDINAFAGQGVGDGEVLVAAKLSDPSALARDAQGNLYVGEAGRIRRITPEGHITTYAGVGQTGYTGDGGPATQAQIGNAPALAMAADGTLYFSDFSANAIRQVSGTGIVSTFNATVGAPNALALSSEGVLHAASESRIHRFDAAGNATVVAGTGAWDFTGDGGQATAATFRNIAALAFAPDGALVLVDRGNQRIRRIAPDGVVTTIAGDGSTDTVAEEGPALSVGFSDLYDLAYDADGNLFISDANWVRRLGTDGQVSRHAGNGVYAFAGDGGPARDASLSGPDGLLVSPEGALFIADVQNDRIRVVSDASLRPGAPEAPVATAGIGMAAVGFAPPVVDGGSPILGYDVSVAPAGAADPDAGGDTRVRRFTGLQNGTAYRFAVRAINANGAGPYSPLSDPVTPSEANLTPLLWVTGGSAREGEPLVFTAHLSRASANAVSFNVSSENGSAFAGEDYSAINLVNRFIPAGETRASFSVPTTIDLVAEGDESLRVVVSGVANAVQAVDRAAGTILNVADAVLPPLVLRDDRFELEENVGPQEIGILVNDLVDVAQYADGSIVLTELPARGTVQLVDGGFFGTVADTGARYTPHPDTVGEDAFGYRVCDRNGQCDEARVTLMVRPNYPFATNTVGASGKATLDIDGLRALAAAEFRATPMVAPNTVRVALAVDPTPGTPWDAAMAGTATTLRTLAAAPGGAARSFRVLVESGLAPTGASHLFAGIDDNNDGQASADELRCSSAMSGSGETCDFELVQPADTAVAYWVLAQNVDAAAVEVDVHDYAVPLQAGDGSLVATGPAVVPAGEGFAAILSWNDPGLLSGEQRVGFVRVKADAGTAMGEFPVRIRRTSSSQSPTLLAKGAPMALRLAAGASHERLFIDVPAGASSLDVLVQTSDGVDVYLAPAADESFNAPPRASAVASSIGESGERSVVVSGAALVPGRWFVTPVNRSTGAPAAVTLVANLAGAAPVVRPGSYFNAARSGHGLFLYPAGSQLAGIWYTYLPDTTPTWYYLQGPAPGVDGVWNATLYRSAWDGDSNQLTSIGRAAVTPTAADAFRFSFLIDGEVGSEPMTALGRGCPTLSGLPLDASSHWFNPARAGTGYSVQLFANYEFYTAFVYDQRGIARYLLAERNGFGGASADLVLEQLKGFCPTCTRLAAPTRSDVGVLGRSYTASGLASLQLDGLYVDGVPGAWTADETVQLLGGAGTAQGCAP